jgi:hypothetical protein
LRPESIEAVAQAATRAFRERRFHDAAAGYERCVAMNPKAPAFHFNLGTAREFGGDLSGAIKAYLSAWNLNPSDGRLALFAGAALAAAGRRGDAAILFSLGDDVDPAVRQAKDRPDFDSEIRRRSETADRVMRELFTNLHEDAVAEFERHLPGSGNGPPPDLSRVRRAIWPQTHARPFSYRTKKQQPTLFYMPDLPATAIFPRERLPWAGAVEAATEAVREEYVEALREGAAMSPYVDPKTRAPIWHSLRGNMDWSSLHLYKMAQETPLARHFPRTLEALAAAEIVRIDGKPVELFFSRLRPGTYSAALRRLQQSHHHSPAPDRARRMLDPRRRRIPCLARGRAVRIRRQLRARSLEPGRLGSRRAHLRVTPSGPRRSGAAVRRICDRAARPMAAGADRARRMSGRPGKGAQLASASTPRYARTPS